MADTASRRLPRGRHGLSREEVEENQRLRILVGMAEAMRDGGYVGTSVADVIVRAGVSRETFYRLFDDKLDCFLAAFDAVADLLVGELAASLGDQGAPIDRFERALSAYLGTMAAEPGFARLFVVEVHAAGPAAMARRTALQDRIVDALVELFGASRRGGRVACQVLVAAVSAMVTGPLVAEDLDALGKLHAPLLAHARALVDAGIL